MGRSKQITFIEKNKQLLEMDAPSINKHVELLGQKKSLLMFNLTYYIVYNNYDKIENETK